MMKKSTIWKSVAFVLMFVCVLTCAMKMTATADAIDAANVHVDYVNESITVETTEDKIIYYTETYNKDLSRWDACEVRNGKAVFDISWINSNKTVRIYICGDENTDVINADITWEEDFKVEFTGTLLSTDITEADKWKKAYEGDGTQGSGYPNFDESTGYFIFSLKENGRNNYYFDMENIQWRKGSDGVWRDYDELDLREMSIRGIRLEFRVVANNGNPDADVAPSRASSVAAITVSKQTTAPKITVSAESMCVVLKNGMEFSFDKENWFLIPEYNKKFGTDVKFVTKEDRKDAIEEIYTTQRVSSVLIQELIKQQVEDFPMNSAMDEDTLKAACGSDVKYGDKGILLYVREAGKARKSASKAAEVQLPYAVKEMEQEIAAADAKIKFSYGDSKTNTGGIVIENTSEYKYQVGVITPQDKEFAKIGTAEEANIDLSTIKWTSVKGDRMVKIMNKKAPAGSYLIYRIGSEDGNLPTSCKLYGPLEYDHLTYAGIASAKKMTGETLEAVASTNMYDDDRNLVDSLSFEWQRCFDVKAEEVEWEAISGANGSTYTLTEDDANCYVRVKITDEYDNEKYSEEFGPIKLAVPKATPTPATP